MLQAKAWIDAGLYTARQAREVGMIDELVYESQLEQRLEQELGLEKPSGDTDNANISMSTEDEQQIDEEESGKEDETLLETVSVSQYARVDIDAPGLHTAGEKIAVVYATGTIVMGKSAPPGSQPLIGADTMTQVFAALAADDEIKGVILRIDSGGGGGLASDIIRNSVEEVLEKKPVVVSMGDVAASGGYMIAIPAESIVAYPLTLTGSIGIFGGKFSLEGLADLVGIHIETLQRGRNAGLFATSRVHTPEEHERFQLYLQHHYNDFVEHVAQGRKMAVATVNQVAQGRVWLGSEAFELGLVDALGGLDTAIAIIKARLEIPEESDVLLIPYPQAGNPIEVLLQRFRDTFVSITMPPELQHLRAYLQELVQLQDEQIFAWWPARFFID
jgi:protease-4